MATGVASWSQTAASNASGDSAVNWAEGQSPSSVNDSARAMMASVAKYRDDVAGAITTGGTATAYTVTSNQGFASLSALNGMVIAFTIHATNTAACTLAVDGLTAKPLRSSGGVELAPGTLITGTPYVAIYNSGNGEFYLHGYAVRNYDIPLGGILIYPLNSAPTSNFAFMNGQSISRTVYSRLFSAIGTTYGVGDGSTTFGIPDMRGCVPVGLETMGGVSSSGRTGGFISSSTIGTIGGAESHALSSAEMPSHTHTATATVTDPGHTHPIYVNQVGSGGGVNSYVGFSNGTTLATNSATTGISVGVTNTNTGSGTAHSLLQPSIVITFIMRVI